MLSSGREVRLGWGGGRSEWGGIIFWGSVVLEIGWVERIVNLGLPKFRRELEWSV